MQQQFQPEEASSHSINHPRYVRTTNESCCTSNATALNIYTPLRGILQKNSLGTFDYILAIHRSLSTNIIFETIVKYKYCTWDDCKTTKRHASSSGSNPRWKSLRDERTEEEERRGSRHRDETNASQANKDRGGKVARMVASGVRAFCWFVRWNTANNPPERRRQKAELIARSVYPFRRILALKRS